MREIGDWFLVALTVAMIVFTIIYGLRSKWWSNEVGRVFLPEKVLMCLVLFQVSLSAVTRSTYPYRDEARLLLYGLGFLSLVWMIGLLLKIQGREHKCRKDIASCEEVE